MQKKLDNKQMKHFCSANGIPIEVETLEISAMYRKQRTQVVEAYIASFSDASFNVSASTFDCAAHILQARCNECKMILYAPWQVAAH